MSNQCEDRWTNNSLKTDKICDCNSYIVFLFKFTALYLLHTYVGITGTHFVGCNTTTSFCDRVS